MKYFSNWSLIAIFKLIIISTISGHLIVWVKKKLNFSKLSLFLSILLLLFTRIISPYYYYYNDCYYCEFTIIFFFWYFLDIFPFWFLDIIIALTRIGFKIIFHCCLFSLLNLFWSNIRNSMLFIEVPNI